MNQTTHYQLNQWEPEDQVKRVDFNADNAKIDAAIAGVAGKAATAPDVLLRYTLSAASHTAVLNFSQAKTYDVLRLLFWGLAASSAELCFLQMNGITEHGRYIWQSGSSSSSADTVIMLGRAEKEVNGGGVMDIWLYPAGQHTLVRNSCSGVNSSTLMAAQTYGAGLDTSFSSLSQISILLGRDSGQFAVGTKAILLGYKF